MALSSPAALGWLGLGCGLRTSALNQFFCKAKIQNQSAFWLITRYWQHSAAMFQARHAALEIVLLRPERTEEMERAVNLLQSHATVVVDLQLLDGSQAQRFIDFLSGAVWSLDGTIERVSEQVIVAAPMSVLLSS